MIIRHIPGLVHDRSNHAFDNFAQHFKPFSMLAYFSYGQRHYYERPIPYMVRRFWEFQAVIDGRIEQIQHGTRDDRIDPRSRTLWISPPNSDHGWIGEEGKEATIVVFHFQQIPDTLLARLSDTRTTVIPINEEECNQLCQLAEKVQNYWDKSLPGASLCYQFALHNLSLLSFEALARAIPTKERARTEQRVQKALLWYNEHMSENPTLDEIASQVHSSPANLRRLFHKSYHASPKKLFDQLRYQKALQLLTETDRTMAAIAEACGFEDQSAFSRAFKQQFQCSPIEMRQPRKA